MQELLQKKYKFPIRFLNGKTYHINYSQATLRELLEMSNVIKNNDKLMSWLYNFLNNHCEDEITVKSFSDLQQKHINSILEFLFDTYTKGYFEKIKNNTEITSPTSSFIAFILEHTNETTESLLNMTWEQIQYIVEGLSWNIREQSKDGKAENKRQWALKQARLVQNDDEALKQAKELEKRMNKINFKKVKSNKI